MGIYHFTKKLCDYLGREYIDQQFTREDVEDKTILGAWSAKPITLIQKRYILFANDKTLLTLLIQYSPKDMLLLRFREELFMELKSIGINSLHASAEAEMFEGKNKLDSKLDRSVLGSINDLEYQYNGILQIQYNRFGKIDFKMAQSSANDTPHVKRENNFPKDYVVKLFKEKNR